MTATNARLRGLYAITDGTRDTALLVRKVSLALAGGARVIQYRDKHSDGDHRREQALSLAQLCNAANVPLIINDDVDLTLACGADGVHLGGDDVTIATARRALGENRLIGASCYNRLDLARKAVADGADYVAFGSFFASPTKPNAVRATPELLRAARTELKVPLVAIGGISPENAALLVTAGADMLAVISAVFSAPDIESAAQSFAAEFASSGGTPA